MNTKALLRRAVRKLPPPRDGEAVRVLRTGRDLLLGREAPKPERSPAQAAPAPAPAPEPAASAISPPLPGIDLDIDAHAAVRQSRRPYLQRWVLRRTARRALVTMFNIAPWGGLHENIWYSCLGLKQRGWDITVACRSGELVQKLEADGIGVHVVRDWADWSRDTEILAKQNWDLVHTHPFASRSLGQAVAEAVHAPLISTFHGYNLDELPGWVDSVSALMAVSPAHAEMLRRVPGVDSSRVFVVRNGVRDALLDAPVSTLDEKTRGGQARVVVASRLDKDKRGLLDCVSAVVEALGRDPLGIRWVLEILGAGHLSADMQAFMQDRVAKAPNVDFDIAGWVDSEEVAERMRHAVISIASGRGAAQSLAVGTPVVAFGSQGVYGLQHAQNLDHGLWGNFGGYPLGDREVTPIASDVAWLLRDVLEYSRVQVEGQKAAREHLLQSDIDRTLARIYQSNGGSQERRGVGRILKRLDHAAADRQ